MPLRYYLKERFPHVWHRLVLTRKLATLLRRSYGYHKRVCPICEYSGYFTAEVHFPDIFTFDAICPSCGSLPRNRLLFLANRGLGLVRSKDRVLHFAPEDAVRRFISSDPQIYKTADLFASNVDLKINIEAIDQPDGSWDRIICSHVLEHVDHQAALRELYRILAPGGKLLALFPVIEGWPEHYERKDVVSEYDRALHFGKTNHVRRLGGNIRREIEQAGFALSCFSPIGEDVVVYGLIPGETLFVAARPSDPQIS